MLGSAQPCLAAQATAWWLRLQTRKAAHVPTHPSAMQTSPLTPGIVLRIKPLPTALVVAQQRHSSGVLAVSFTPSTKIPSISPLPVIPTSASPQFPAQALGGRFAYLWRQQEEVAGNWRTG